MNFNEIFVSLNNEVYLFHALDPEFTIVVRGGEVESRFDRGIPLLHSVAVLCVERLENKSPGYL